MRHRSVIPSSDFRSTYMQQLVTLKEHGGLSRTRYVFSRKQCQNVTNFDLKLSSYKQLWKMNLFRIERHFISFTERLLSVGFRLFPIASAHAVFVSRYALWHSLVILTTRYSVGDLVMVTHLFESFLFNLDSVSMTNVYMSNVFYLCDQNVWFTLLI